MNNTFKIGSIVMLKSGGPGMTITYISDSMATCSFWNFSKNEFNTSKFKLDCLKEFHPNFVKIAKA